MNRPDRYRGRVILALLYAVLAMLAVAALQGCDSTRHEFALVASQHNAQITEARNEEFTAFVMATDARERASLERELDLIAAAGEQAIDAKFTRDLFAATETLAPAGGAGSPGVEAGASRPNAGAPLDDGAPALRRYVAVDAVETLVAKQNADRAATRAAIAAKRAAITAVLDAELKKWLNDPKAKQQSRVAAALSVYAQQNSEFARFIAATGAQFGVSIPGSTP